MMDLNGIRKIFSNDRFATEAAGITIEDATDRHSVCSLKVRDIHLNAAGTVMGGVLFTLADFAFAVASNYTEMRTVSQTSQITFLAAAKTKELTAEAVCIKDGSKTCVYTVTIRDSAGTDVAFVTVTGFKL